MEDEATQVTPAMLAVALGGLFAGALVGWFFRGVALIAAADHREVAKPDDGLCIGWEPSEPKRDLAAMNFTAVPELRALTKDERLRCARGMPELLPSAAEMTGEILVDDKSELIAKVTADRSFYEGLHAHIKHARDDANTLLEMIESAEGGASHWRRRTLPPLKGAPKLTSSPARSP
jgi:hypothetical protein